MARQALPALLDMLDALNGIARATKGKTYEQFCDDWVLRHAVQRAIEIVSEAARHLPASIIEHQPQIPWPKIKAMGNILRHEYHRIADQVIWAVVTDHLPDLRVTIALLIDGMRDTDEDDPR